MLQQVEIMYIQNQVNLRQIYIDVFNLFGVKWKYDPVLSVQKLYTYYSKEEEEIGEFIECL